MDHSKHTPMTQMELTEDKMKNANVYGPDDSKVGSVHEVFGTGDMAKAIVDVGGFLGLGSKSVALDVSRLNFMRDESGTVLATTRMTKDEMKDLPEHNPS